MLLQHVTYWIIILASHSHLIFLIKSMNTSALLAVTGISLISLVGIFTISINQNFLKRITLFLISLAAGSMIGSVFFQILPELYELTENAEVAGGIVVCGLVIFFLLEKVLHWNHCHQGLEKDHKHSLAIKNIFADGLHNFVDGLLIGAAFTVDTEIGIAAAIAIALHEIPQEIGDFGILIHSGLSTRKALVLNFVSALLAVIGTLLAFVVGDVNEDFSAVLLGIAAGGFIYIAVADLLPEIKHEDDTKKSLMQVVFFSVGLLLMLGVSLTVPHTHEHDDDDHDHEFHSAN